MTSYNYNPLTGEARVDGKLTVPQWVNSPKWCEGIAVLHVVNTSLSVPRNLQGIIILNSSRADIDGKFEGSVCLQGHSHVDVRGALWGSLNLAVGATATIHPGGSVLGSIDGYGRLLIEEGFVEAVVSPDTKVTVHKGTLIQR